MTDAETLLQQCAQAFKMIKDLSGNQKIKHESHLMTEKIGDYLVHGKYRAQVAAPSDSRQTVDVDESGKVKFAYLSGILESTNTPIPNDDDIQNMHIGMPRKGKSDDDKNILSWFKKHQDVIRHCLTTPAQPVAAPAVSRDDARAALKVWMRYNVMIQPVHDYKCVSYKTFRCTCNAENEFTDIEFMKIRIRTLLEAAAKETT